MKVISVINTSKPNECSYKEVGVVMILKRHGYTFAISKSYNSLISCYAVTEHSTGRELTAFTLPLNMQDSDVDRVVERANAHLDKHTPEFIKQYIEKFPVVNEDDPDESQSPDYSDVKLKQILKQQNEKVLMEKMTNPKKKKVVEKEKVSAIKKKRGRPKKVVVEDNTLF